MQHTDLLECLLVLTVHWSRQTVNVQVFLNNLHKSIYAYNLDNVFAVAGVTVFDTASSEPVHVGSLSCWVFTVCS